MDSCDKRAFGSKKAARKAVGSMHQSVRVYWCKNCGFYHNTKERYAPQGTPDRLRKRGKKS